jgi:hypothetical protein
MKKPIVFNQAPAENTKGKGYIFIVSNWGYPGCVKIGKTKREPDNYAERLTRILKSPYPFISEWHRFIDSDIHDLKRFVYDRLKKFEINEGGTFFQMSVPMAIETVDKAICDFLIRENHA